MKITELKTRVVQMPIGTLLEREDASENITRPFVTLELFTDEGITGIGTTCFGGLLTGALRQAVKALGELVIGKNPLRVEEIAADLRKAASSSGPAGIFTLALSAIDIALWDIKGKALSQPLSTVLGGYRDRALTYASGALNRDMPLAYLEKAGTRLIEMGFRQMKTQLGAEPTVSRELQRIQVLRGAIGDDIDLMCDINQLWQTHQAVEVGKRLEEYHLFWLEDVTAHDDYQGLARIADALTTPVCAGEYHYGIRPFRHMLEARSIDIVMIDLLRAGGITQWMKIAGMAEAYNLPVVSHLFPEIAVHLITAIPNGLTVEYMPWTLRLFEETPTIEAGQIAVPQKPGLGLQFDAQALKLYQVS